MAVRLRALTICLLWLGSVERIVSAAVKWQAPHIRPSAFGQFPTNATQKVIGLGYPKTGTVSLAKVIDSFGLTHLHGNLGYKPEDWHGESIRSMEEVLGGVDAWLEMLGRFEMDKLLALYPKAKYILTTRDPDAWYRSATRFFEGKMTEEYFVRHFGSANFDDAETWKASFLAHNLKVMRTIPSEQLLVIDLTTGDSIENLQKLCSFLEVTECPSGGVPHEHSTDKVLERDARKKERRLESGSVRSPRLPKRDQPLIYTTMISSQSPTLDQDLEKVKAWALSLIETHTKYNLLCAVLGGSLSEDQESALERLVSVFHLPHDGEVSDLPIGVEDAYEIRLDMAKRQLARLPVKALMYMEPGSVATQNLDARLEDFSSSGRVFEGFARSDYAAPDSGVFLLAPRWQMVRLVQQIANTRSWSPERGWLSAGRIDLAGNPVGSWNFPGSSGGLGLFLSACLRSGRIEIGDDDQKGSVDGSASQEGLQVSWRKCAFTAPMREAFCSGDDESHHCQERRAALARPSVLAMAAPPRPRIGRSLAFIGDTKNTHYDWTSGSDCYVYWSQYVATGTGSGDADWVQYSGTEWSSTEVDSTKCGATTVLVTTTTAPTTTADVTTTTADVTTTTAEVTTTSAEVTTTSAEVTSTSAEVTTTTADVTTTSAEVTTTSAEVTTTSAEVTTTTAEVTSTSAEVTTTNADVSSTTIADVSTTTVADVSSSTVADVSTTTIADVSTTTIADVSSTTVADMSTTTIADVSSTTIADVSSTAIADVSTTTIADVITTTIADVSTTTAEASTTVSAASTTSRQSSGFTTTEAGTTSEGETTTEAAGTTVGASTTQQQVDPQGWYVYYYYAQTRNGLVYKCNAATNACDIFLDKSSITSLIPSLSTFYPTSVHVDQEADGTPRGLVIGTSTGEVIFCDTTASACEIVGSVGQATTGLGSAWDSDHAISQYAVATSSGTKTLSADGTGTITSASTWVLARGAFFLTSPDSDSSDIIACTKRKRVERCPYSLDGSLSDCTFLVKGKCTGIAPEYNATGYLTRFAVMFKNRLETCEVNGMNCEVVDGEATGTAGTGDAQLADPTEVAVERVGTQGASAAYWILDDGNSRLKRCEVGGDCAIYTDISADALAVTANASQAEVAPSDSVSTATVSTEVQVTIENVENFADLVGENSNDWFGIEETLESVSSEDGWTLESVEKVGETTSGTRRLATLSEYLLTFKLRYVVGTRNFSDISTVLSTVVQNFDSAVNEQVGQGNWSVVEIAYAATKDDVTTEVVSYGPTPDGARLTEATWSYDSTPSNSGFGAALLSLLFCFVLAVLAGN